MKKIDIEQAIKAVKLGKLIVLPTDTVYGIGVDPSKTDNIKILLEVKGRGKEKPPPILVANIEQARNIAEIKDDFIPLLKEFWPGALTVVLPMKSGLNWDLGDKNSTVALRIPDNDLALELLTFTGPLAVTSANLTSFPPAIKVEEAIGYFGDKVESYIDGGKAKIGNSSTILDLTSNIPKILRKGDITIQMLKVFLSNITQ